MKDMKRYNPNTFNALHAATAYLLFWAMMFGVSMLFVPIMEHVSPGADLSPYLCLESVLIAAGLALVTAIMALAAKVNPVNGGGFLSRKGCGVEMLMAAVLIFGMAILFSPLAESFAETIEELRTLLRLPARTEPSIEYGGWFLLYYLILVPVLPAIFEELLFRGVILKGFMQFGKMPAVILSALLFALAHGSYQQFIYQFLVGLVIGALVVETKNIVVGMAAHFANNFFASWSVLVYGFALGRNGEEIYVSIISIMTFLLGTVCLIAGLVYFVKRMFHSQKYPERARGDIAATFVVHDMVSGTLLEERPWYSCGALTEKHAEQRCYLAENNGRGKLNRKAGIFPAVLVLAIGLAAALFVAIGAFIGGV